MAGISNFTSETLYFPDIDLRLPIVTSPPPRGEPDRGQRQNQVWLGQAGPSELNQDLLAQRTVPHIWLNRGLGMGASQFDADLSNDGDYSHGLRIASRTPGSFMPAGDDVEVDITALGNAGACTASVIYGGSDLYFAYGRYVVKVAAGVDAGPLTIERDLGASFVAKRMALFEGVLYVGGAGGFMWRYNGGWSQSADVPALDLATVFWTTPDGVIGQRLVIADTATSFRSVVEASAPMTLANYAARIQIAGGSYPINSIVAANQVVWFATAGGLAAVDSRGYSPILNPYLATMYSNSLTGETSFYHDGYVYMSTFQGLDRIDVSSAQRYDTPSAVQPGIGTSAEHPIYGRCTAMVAEGGYLLANFYNNAGDSYVMAGKPDPGAPSGMRWYGPEFHLIGERITHMRVHVTSPSNNPCIWVCSLSGVTPKLRYLFIPKAATHQQEFLQNRNTAGTYTGTMRWAESWQLVFGDIDLGDQNAKKLIESYNASTRGLNSTTTYFRLFANAEGGNYFQQGTGDDPKLQASPRSQLIPTQPLGEAYNLGVRLDGYGTTTAPAILNQLKSRLELLQDLRPSTTYQVLLGPVEELRGGARLDQDVQEKLDLLLGLQSQGPKQMIDQYGNTQPAAKVEPGITWGPKRVERVGAASEEFQLIATVAITLIPTTEEQLSSGSAAPPAEIFPTLIWDSGSWDQSSWA